MGDQMFMEEQEEEQKIIELQKLEKMEKQRQFDRLKIKVADEMFLKVKRMMEVPDERKQ